MLPGDLMFHQFTLGLLFVVAAARNIFTPGRVAVTAVGGVEFSADIDRMNKSRHLGPRGNVLLFLAENGVTEVTILGDNPAVGRFVSAVMTTETARGVEVPDMIGIGVPGDFHFREKVP
jgi:hypothetical protein